MQHIHLSIESDGSNIHKYMADIIHRKKKIQVFKKINEKYFYVMQSGILQFSTNYICMKNVDLIASGNSSDFRKGTESVFLSGYLINHKPFNKLIAKGIKAMKINYSKDYKSFVDISNYNKVNHVDYLDILSGSHLTSSEEFQDVPSFDIFGYNKIKD